MYASDAARRASCLIFSASSDFEARFFFLAVDLSAKYNGCDLDFSFPFLEAFVLVALGVTGTLSVMFLSCRSLRILCATDWGLGVRLTLFESSVNDDNDATSVLKLTRFLALMPLPMCPFYV